MRKFAQHKILSNCYHAYVHMHVYIFICMSYVISHTESKDEMNVLVSRQTRQRVYHPKIITNWTESVRGRRVRACVVKLCGRRFNPHTCSPSLAEMGMNPRGFIGQITPTTNIPIPVIPPLLQEQPACTLACILYMYIITVIICICVFK